MKWLLFMVCSFVLLIPPAKAQDPALIALSQKEAVREFPSLALPDSSLNKRFVERVKSLRVAKDSVLLRDDWPLLVTKQVALEVGAEPVATLPSRQPLDATPKPTPTPWIPKGTMLDANNHNSADPMASNTGNDGAKPSNKKFFIYGTVVRKNDDGLMVSCMTPRSVGYESPSGIVWLTDRESTLGHVVKTMAVKAGKYTYVSPDGLKETLDEYKAEQ